MKVSFIGLGLIGSSLALSISQNESDLDLIGWDQNPSFLKEAYDRGFIDQMATSLEQAVALADILILAIPVEATMQVLRDLPQMDHKPGLLVTDTASTKGEIMRLSGQVFAQQDIDFIGGHPMAGSHKTGPSAADLTLFENAYYILCPQEESHPKLDQLQQLLAGTGARFVQVDPQEHDLVTSQISHFPHLLASSLVGQTADFSEEHEWTARFAAGGFRDMTRIAESDAQMWTSILLSNQDALIQRIADFKERLTHLADLIEQGQKEDLTAFFDKGRQKRKAMQIHQRAGVDSFYDLFVSVPDRKDVVLEILEIIRGISLVNIHINEENREDLFGHLQLTFKNAKDRDLAYEKIQQATDYALRLG